MLCNPKDPKMLHELERHAPLIHVLLAANKLKPVSYLTVQAKIYSFINFHLSLFENFHNMKNIMRSWEIISFICPIKEPMCSGSRHENLESCESHLDYINTSLLTLDETKQVICKCESHGLSLYRTGFVHIAKWSKHAYCAYDLYGLKLSCFTYSIHYIRNKR